jgi:hypothetical protein
MIVKEYYTTRADGVKLYRNYSDSGLKIVQNETGVIYDEAIDVENAPYTYSESDEPIEAESEDEQKAKAYDILMGVAE